MSLHIVGGEIQILNDRLSGQLGQLLLCRLQRSQAQALFTLARLQVFAILTGDEHQDAVSQCG